MYIYVDTPIRTSIHVNESAQIYLRIYLYSHEITDYLRYMGSMYYGMHTTICELKRVNCITDHLSMYVVYVLWAAYHNIRI